jgi:flagellar biosynthesis/type III secretory pathway protein FliH
MGKIIKVTENPDSVATIEYTPLGEEAALSVSIGREEVVTVRGVSDVKQRIQQLIREAEDKAEEIIREANLEAAEIRDQALKAGYETGQETAVKEVRERIDSISRAFGEGLEGIASLKGSILARAEDDMVRLAIAIAEKLLCRELREHPDTIAIIVKEAIKTAEDKTEIIVKVNPDDYTTLKRYMGQLMEHINGANAGKRQNAPIKIIEDPDMTSGGCIVETETSIVDMSVEARMTAVDQLISTPSANHEK